jgi:hypothetical protein
MSPLAKAFCEVIIVVAANMAAKPGTKHIEMRTSVNEINETSLGCVEYIR